MGEIGPSNDGRPATRQFAEAGGAPFQAIADMCFADVKGVWDPFEKASSGR